MRFVVVGNGALMAFAGALKVGLRNQSMRYC